MPLVYQQNINLDTRLAVWHIAENEDHFLHKVSLQSEIRHPHKRLQHLAGRYLLKELFPDFPLEFILVAETKKPFLPGDPFHFSISHCGDYAAAIVSTLNRVGTDIEIPQKKISAIMHKFLKANELELLHNLSLTAEQSLTLAWSIKEAIFKWYGEGKVDFRGHIDIAGINSNGNEFTAVCNFTKNEGARLLVHGLFFNGNCLTWVVS